MKYLKYILGGLALLFFAFILIGIIKSEVAYQGEVLVDKPLAESWQVAQDPNKAADWLVGFKRMQHVSGTPGTVGAVSDIYFDENGEEMSIRETITEIVPFESISMTYTSDFMDMDYQMKMTPVEGKTQISSTTIASGNGVFSKSITALVKGTMVAQEEANLESLKKVIEENTTNYAQGKTEVLEVIED